MVSFLISLALMGTVYSQLTAPNCPVPVDIDCLISQAQFTVLGSIQDNNKGKSTLASDINYNATMRIDCAYASFSDPVSSLVKGGETYTVTNWGNPKPACSVAKKGGKSRASYSLLGTGSTANPGDQRIYFLFVQNKPGPNDKPVLSVFDVCNGGFPVTQENLGRVYLGLNMKGNEKNRLLTGMNCSLPTVNGTFKFTPSSGKGNEFPDDTTDTVVSQGFTLVTSMSMALMVAFAMAGL